MRFVLLTQYFPPEIGAPQARLSALARALVERGHDVEVVTAMPNYPRGSIDPDYRGKIYRREERDGATVHRVWIFAAMGRGLRRLLSYWSFCLLCVIGLARCRRPQVVLIESPPLFAGPVGLIAAKLWRSVAVLNVADLWPDAAVELGAVSQGLAVRVAHVLERACYNTADVVNAATEGLATTIRSRTTRSDHVIVLPNGVDTTLFTPDRGRVERLHQLGLPRDRLFIHAGTMSYIHGLENVVRAFADQPAFTLALIGAGSHEPELRELVGRLSASNVRFIEPMPLDELAEILPLATGAVVSVRSIPQAELVRPSKLFPAMAAGRPVLYAGHGEGADLVRTAECGIVVPNDDERLIADAMVEISESPGDMGIKGRRWVQANLTWSAIVDCWLAELGSRGLLNGPKPPRRTRVPSSR